MAKIATTFEMSKADLLVPTGTCTRHLLFKIKSMLQVLVQSVVIVDVSSSPRASLEFLLDPTCPVVQIVPCGQHIVQRHERDSGRSACGSDETL